MKSEWTFTYKSSAVLLGAASKADYHNSRVKFWTDKKDEVMAKIKSEGLEFDESLVDMTSNKFSGGYRDTSVSVRDDLLRDLQECGRKLREHRIKLEDYKAWVQVLDSQGDKDLQLDQQDWLFFFDSPSVKKDDEASK